MTTTRVTLCLCFAFLFYVAQGAKITFTNRCEYTVWPVTLTGDNKPQLTSTGFELSPGASNTLDLPSPWSGAFWGRTGCSNNNDGRFSCAIADCASGQVACNGAGSNPPATKAEITVAANGGQDFYDVSNVDGFNVRMSLAPQGGSGGCRTPSCPNDINTQCLNELQVKGSDGSVIACKSACVAFGEDRYCCRGPNNTSETCPATNYSQFFKNLCPDAYSYAYDDITGTFTCSNSPDYVLTFCP